MNNTLKELEVPTKSFPLIEKNLELGVEQLKGNKIPRHLISLEKKFNRHDAYIRRERGKKGGTSRDSEGMGIGTKFKPKMINMGSSCSNEERNMASIFISK